jgi:hypothetical protein
MKNGAIQGLLLLDSTTFHAPKLILKDLYIEPHHISSSITLKGSEEYAEMLERLQTLAAVKP